MERVPSRRAATRVSALMGGPGQPFWATCVGLTDGGRESLRSLQADALGGRRFEPPPPPALPLAAAWGGPWRRQWPCRVPFLPPSRGAGGAPSGSTRVSQKPVGSDGQSCVTRSARGRRLCPSACLCQS